MRQLIPICCVCERVRDDTGTEPGLGPWKEFRVYKTTHILNPRDIMFSHGYCPTCLTRYGAVLAGSNKARPRPEKRDSA
jgi:hypothetical protein